MGIIKNLGMKKIIVFASGNGSNFQNIADYFANNQLIKIELLISNKADAYVLERAKELDIPSMVITKNSFYETDEIVTVLKELNPDLIVLSGFLWLIPENIISAFEHKIINIHPALLPKYGGKGMYGMNVHKAIAENKESETGISIHYVSKEYDKGDLIFQTKCKLSPQDTPEMIAEKVHRLEYEFFPKTIQSLLLKS